MTRVLTTGVGSLPFESVREALDHVFEAYTLPFYPQLPRLAVGGPPSPAESGDDGLQQGRPCRDSKSRHSPASRDEDAKPDAGDGGRDIPQMLGEVLTPLARAFIREKRHKDLLVLLEADAEDERAARGLLETLPGFPEFCDRVRGFEGAKMQLVGPRTLAAWLGNDEALPFCWAWIETLSRAALKMIPTRTSLFWDDALLATRPLAGEAERLRKSGYGLHCCAPASGPELLSVFRGAWLALDLHAVTLENEALAEHFAAGGNVVFGIYDTAAATLGSEKLPPAGILYRDPVVLSGGCGTGLKTPEFERALADGLKVAKMVVESTLL